MLADSAEGDEGGLGGQVGQEGEGARASGPPVEGPGTAAAARAGVLEMDTEEEISPTVWASILASVVTKRASRLAFRRRRRSMTAPDVIDSLGEAFDEVVGEIYDDL